jgi:hypothetical protein
MTPDQVKRMMEDILKKKNIRVDIMYWIHSNHDNSITATVYLYKDNEIMGYRRGYNFFFNYDKRFDELTPDGNYPKLQNLDFFKNLPDEVITQYFTDKAQEYLRGYIDRGNVSSFKVVNK